MVSASHVQSPAQGGGSQIAFQWLHYTHCEHCSQHNSLRALLENTICEPMVEGLIMWWGHIIHRGVWERLRYGSPLPPNENQTMFKGTIKIFLQHFISGGDHINLIHMDVIWGIKSVENSIKKSFYCTYQYTHRMLPVSSFESPDFQIFVRIYEVYEKLSTSFEHFWRCSWCEFYGTFCYIWQYLGLYFVKYMCISKHISGCILWTLNVMSVCGGAAGV